MQKTDNVFLEEYKRLDKICSDMYSEQHGVSVYIENLQRTGRFKDDYYKLKHLRWLRNQLVHDLNPQHATEADVSDVRVFYERIMKGTDPLAMLEKSRRKSSSSKEKRQRTSKKKSAKVGIVLMIILILLVAAAVFAAYFLGR